MTRTNATARLALVFGTIVLLGAVSACGGGSSSDKTAAPTIDTAWARPAAAGANTAVYLTIHGADTDDALIGATAESGFADKIEIHETTSSMGSGGHDTKMKTMRPVDKVDIPANGTVELKPGGYHVMATKLAKALKVGDTVTVTLRFDKGGTVEVTAPVREM